MNKRKLIKNICSILIIIELLMCVFNFINGFYCYADNEIINFETSNVLEDLLSADADIVTKLPPNENASPQIQVIQLVEYCYSYRENMRDNYGLYVYVYNPTNLKINTKTKSNQIQLAVAYDSNPITSESRATDYDKFDLQYCNSSGGEFANLYLKFKIVDKTGKDGLTIAKRVNPAERRYDCSSIELLVDNMSNATDYAVGKTFIFKGYASGYGFDENITESTLECTSKKLDTISLDVNHTYYRTLTSSKGIGFQNQIDTVYFSVPNEFFDTYGTLQRIKAEWYEFKTKDIFVTNNNEAYKVAENPNPLSSLSQNILGNNLDGGLVWATGSLDPASQSSFDNLQSTIGAEYVDKLLMNFYLDCEEIKSYDPALSTYENGVLKGNDLLEKILNYNKTYTNGSLPIKNSKISLDLFQNDLDAYRKIDNEVGIIQYGGYGKSYYDFDANVDILSWKAWNDSSHSFFENANAFGFFNTLFGNIPKETGKSIDPIYIVKSKDLVGTNEEISNNLIINQNDVDIVKSNYTSAVANNETLVLFRFAVTDYYSQMVDLAIMDSTKVGYAPDVTYDCGYRARESVFLDFDVIQLTFMKDNTFYVIPVVSNPVDIVNDVTPPFVMNDSDFFKIILALLFLILLIVILAPFLPTIITLIFKIIKFIFKLVINIISLPFKLLRKLK